MRRTTLAGAIFGIWFLAFSGALAIPAWGQDVPPLAPPDHSDNVPGNLRELGPGYIADGGDVLPPGTYFFWVAPKINNQRPENWKWRRLGPYHLTGGRRYKVIHGQELYTIKVNEFRNPRYGQMEPSKWALHPENLWRDWVGFIVEREPGQFVIWDTLTLVTAPGPPRPSGNQPKGGGDLMVDETKWIVDGHETPWVFHANGTVEAPGLWGGAWTRLGEGADGITVTLEHQGAYDSFLVKFSPDGQSFTAYKSGSVYRRGVRTR